MNKVKFLYVITVLFTALALSALSAGTAEAAELTPSFSISTGGNGEALKDGSHSTYLIFAAGSSVTVSAADGSAISGIYIMWDSPVGEWTLSTDSGDTVCGKNGFLHEYVALDVPASSAVINIPGSDTRISGIRIFGDGELPEDVQVWNPPCEKADIMLVPAHADDEILFFGGIIPTYAVERNVQIQVVYMSEFWTSAHIREHEKLDGLWAAGLKNYPISGDFPDVFSEDIETAQTQYNIDEMVSFAVNAIRRFKPQVIISHDLNGEYGHGFHMLTAKAVSLAVTAAADAAQCPESAASYGVWDTPKTYLHLYADNKIRLDLRRPIAAMGGRTALEIAADAYKQHVSQQWCWFYVSDDYEYSCADFGLYRTTVGPDSLGNDIFENLKSYEVQRQEEESRQAAERESISMHESELQSESEHISEKESLDEALSEEQKRLEQENARQNKTRITVILLIALVIVSFVTVFFITGLRRRKR